MDPAQRTVVNVSCRTISVKDRVPPKGGKKKKRGTKISDVGREEHLAEL